MTYDAWKKLPDPEKLDYLFRWNDAIEQAIRRLGANIQLLHERFRKVESAVEETAS